jgi:hypothetical protein
MKHDNNSFSGLKKSTDTSNSMELLKKRFHLSSILSSPFFAQSNTSEDDSDSTESSSLCSLGLGGRRLLVGIDLCQVEVKHARVAMVAAAG